MQVPPANRRGKCIQEVWPARAWHVHVSCVSLGWKLETGTLTVCSTTVVLLLTVLSIQTVYFRPSIIVAAVPEQQHKRVPGAHFPSKVSNQYMPTHCCQRRLSLLRAHRRVGSVSVALPLFRALSLQLANCSVWNSRCHWLMPIPSRNGSGYTERTDTETVKRKA